MRETEKDLAAAVVGWLEASGHVVYQEVEINPGGMGSRADIVAVRDQLSHVVECKQRLSLAVLGQAWRWRSASSYVSVAVSKSSRAELDSWQVGMSFCSDHGVGLLTVDEYGTVRIEVGAKMLPSGYHSQWLDVVTEEHRTHAKAGTSRGGQWTPFRGTIERLEAYVAEHPGVSLKEAAGAVKHHYSSRASFSASVEKMIRKGVITRIELRRQCGGKAHLFPKEVDNACG